MNTFQEFFFSLNVLIVLFHCMNVLTSYPTDTGLWGNPRMSSGLTFICRHCSLFPRVFHIQVEAGSAPRMHSCHMAGLFIVRWRRCLTSAPGRTLSWRRLCPAARQPRMLLPGKQDYVDITGFEEIFRGEQINCAPTNRPLGRLVRRRQNPAVCCGQQLRSEWAKHTYV